MDLEEWAAKAVATTLATMPDWLRRQIEQAAKAGSDE